MGLSGVYQLQHSVGHTMVQVTHQIVAEHPDQEHRRVHASRAVLIKLAPPVALLQLLDAVLMVGPCPIRPPDLLRTQGAIAVLRQGAARMPMFLQVLNQGARKFESFGVGLGSAVHVWANHDQAMGMLSSAQRQRKLGYCQAAIQLVLRANARSGPLHIVCELQRRDVMLGPPFQMHKKRF